MDKKVISCAFNIDTACVEVMFVDGSFDTLTEQTLQYQVPFYLWASFDIPEESVPLTSLNYLPLLLLKTAGIPLSPCYQLLSDVQQAVPAMNSFCVYTPDGRTAMAEASSEQAQWLTLYETVQYYYLFDEKGRSPVLYP